MGPRTMPSIKEAVSTTIGHLKDQVGYFDEHKNEQLMIGNLIDTSLRLFGQLLVINLIQFGKCDTYTSVSDELKNRGTVISSDMIGKYAKATKTADISILLALLKLSERKTKTRWKARQQRTPSLEFRKKE